MTLDMYGNPSVYDMTSAEENPTVKKSVLNREIRRTNCSFLKINNDDHKNVGGGPKPL